MHETTTINWNSVEIVKIQNEHIHTRQQKWEKKKTNKYLIYASPIDVFIHSVKSFFSLPK